MKVRPYLVVALLCTTTATAGRAQTAPLRIVGLVEVPGLFNLFSPDGIRIAAKDFRLELRTRPATDSPVAAAIMAPEQLRAMEYGYEEEGAVVHARDRGWSLVETTEGVGGWLAPADAGTFYSLESLITDGLLFLTDDWNGFLSESPESATRKLVNPAQTLMGFVLSQEKRETSYPVFEHPDRSARIIRRVTAQDPQLALRTGDQFPHQVLVLERRPGWFRVALADQSLREMESAWLEEAPAWRFQAVANEDERRDLAERAWGYQDWAVRTTATRQVGDVLWIEVEVMTHPHCQGDEPTVMAHGWVPAHAPSGYTNIWFYSRGC
jgi:hypothetical protein